MGDESDATYPCKHQYSGKKTVLQAAVGKSVQAEAKIMSEQRITANDEPVATSLSNSP